MLNSNGDKLILSQSNSCILYLARKFNMLGQNEIEVSQCEQLLFETSDLRNVITSFAYTHFEDKEKEQQAAKDVFSRTFDNNNAGKIQKFEHWIENKKNTTSNFLVNNNISAPDFNLFDVLDFYVEFIKHYNFLNNSNDENFFVELGYPNIANFYAKFKQLPKMQNTLILYCISYHIQINLLILDQVSRVMLGIQILQKDNTPSEILIN